MEYWLNTVGRYQGLYSGCLCMTLKEMTENQRLRELLTTWGRETLFMIRLEGLVHWDTLYNSEFFFCKAPNHIVTRPGKTPASEDETWRTVLSLQLKSSPVYLDLIPTFWLRRPSTFPRDWELVGSPCPFDCPLSVYAVQTPVWPSCSLRLGLRTSLKPGAKTVALICGLSSSIGKDPF